MLCCAVLYCAVTAYCSALLIRPSLFSFPLLSSPVTPSPYYRLFLPQTDVQAAKAAAETASLEAKGEKDKKAEKDAVVGAVDPVLGKPISISDIKICPPEEAAAYIKRYNNVLEEKKQTTEEGEVANLSPASSPSKGGGAEKKFPTSEPKGATRTAY